MHRHMTRALRAAATGAAAVALALASAVGTGQAAPQAMRAAAGARDAASPDGWQTSGRTPVTAHVVNFLSDSVTPINTATDRAGRPIPVGCSPDAIAITPDGRTAYVVNGVSETVTPISAATNRAGRPIPVGSLPGAIAITL
jgi:YVTN family beta-propeller protein